MKYLFTFLLIFSLAVFPQNIKKIKLFINNSFDLQKAYSLDIDHEHLFKGKDWGIILYINKDEFRSISKSGLNYEILIDDWKTYYRSLPKMTES